MLGKARVAPLKQMTIPHMELAAAVLQWRYIRINLNPADMESRGVSSSTLVKFKEWIQGPKFLWRTEEKWPQSPIESLSLSGWQVKMITTVFSVVTKGKEKKNPANQLLKHFSRCREQWGGIWKSKIFFRHSRYSPDTKSHTKAQSKIMRNQRKLLRQHLENNQ